jgi:hypothetical protein
VAIPRGAPPGCRVAKVWIPVPSGLIRPKKSAPESVYHMFPSEPSVMSCSETAPGIGNSLTVPSIAATPTFVPSVNQTPFGPLAMPFVPVPVVGNSVRRPPPGGRPVGIVQTLRPCVQATIFFVSRLIVSWPIQTAGRPVP